MPGVWVNAAWALARSPGFAEGATATVAATTGCGCTAAGWPEARLREYVVWAGEVVAGCRGTNPWLEGQFDAAALAALAA